MPCCFWVSLQGPHGYFGTSDVCCRMPLPFPLPFAFQFFMNPPSLCRWKCASFCPPISVWTTDCYILQFICPEDVPRRSGTPCHRGHRLFSRFALHCLVYHCIAFLSRTFLEFILKSYQILFPVKAPSLYSLQTRRNFVPGKF